MGVGLVYPKVERRTDGLEFRDRWVDYFEGSRIGRLKNLYELKFENEVKLHSSPQISISTLEKPRRVPSLEKPCSLIRQAAPNEDWDSEVHSKDENRSRQNNTIVVQFAKIVHATIFMSLSRVDFNRFKCCVRNKLNAHMGGMSQLLFILTLHL